jgi:flagellar motor switch protein FliN
VSNGGLSQEDIDRLLAGGGEASDTEPQPQTEQQEQDGANLSADLPSVEEPAEDLNIQAQTQPLEEPIIAEEPELSNIPTVQQDQDNAVFSSMEEPAEDLNIQTQTQPMEESMIAEEPGPPHIPTVRQVRFTPFPEVQQTPTTNPIDLILDVNLEVTVELGRARKPISEILQLGPGAVIELDKLAGEPVDVLVNGKLVAHGEVVVIDENFGVRITEILSPADRVRSLS